MVQRLNTSGKHYDCYVSRSHVHNALSYKIKFDPYYKDVEIDSLALSMLPTCSTDISQMLHINDDCSKPLALTIASVENIQCDIEYDSQYSTSFMMSLPNNCC